MSRIAAKFAALKKAGQAAFVPFITAGDPDTETAFELLSKLPGAGADVIELGIPFSDPMADGPINQASYLRALAAGMTLPKLVEVVRKFRRADNATPVVLMGAYNPIHAYGTARFMKDAAEAGIDGLLIVDVPAEEDEVLRLPAHAHGIDVVRFLAPTTDEARLKVVLEGATGYLYYASIAGITGTKDYAESEVKTALDRIHAATKLPVVVGFGIKTPEQAGGIARFADGAVVGSAIVSRIESHAAKGTKRADLVADVLDFCASLAKSVHAARGT
ncbi:MAG: tryptophan synthase subunit alpha [Alphaproteobacteria bacterium]|nr:tryptophan synthase subunit alpha [Alphaproteobacteria bacterium]MBV9539763.1 tryptophan synthase subunit alpha [Alphaproteobacteria bacterium]